MAKVGPIPTPSSVRRPSRAHRPGRPDPLAADVRGVRTLRLRANRVVNGICWAGVLFAAFLLFLGVYRGLAVNGLAGLVVVAIAVVVGWACGRRLRPGRLLSLEVTGADVRWVNAFEPSRALVRRRGLRAVIWLARRYPGASPRLRGLYLVDGEGAVLLRTRPATFSQDRLERFFATVQLAVEVVDAAADPFPAVGSDRIR